MTMETCLSELRKVKLRASGRDEIAAVMESASDAKWLQRKTDRERRLVEQYRWLRDYMPSLLTVGSGAIYYDLGCGPGEMLEIARWYGAKVCGVDAATGRNGMGGDYLAMSRARTEAYRIPVEYTGLSDWLTNATASAELRRWATHWTSRGSIEQMLHTCMEGQPHDLHHKCTALAWRESHKTSDVLESMFASMRILSRPKAVVCIHANGAANSDWYCEAVKVAARSTGWNVALDDDANLVHKFELIG